MITMYENETYLFRHVCSVNAVHFSSPHLCSTKSHDGGVEIWYWTEADMCILQTPSPKPTKIPARLNSLRTISTYGFSVRSLSCSHRPWLLLRLAGAKRGYMLTACFTTERNGRKTLTTVQGLPKKFDQKKILKVIKKKFGMSCDLCMCVCAQILTIS